MKISKDNSSLYFLSFLGFWAVIFISEYLYRNGIPFFVCNDSFQYLAVAHDIYLDGKTSGLINYAIDLYYDEIALFGYDLSNLKPYHFPSYPAFLSLFYHIYDNHNFVIYSSQYISFMIFSWGSFLILRHYLDKSKALFLTILSVVSTPLIVYISDSGKEILFSGLSLLAIYFGMYHPKRNAVAMQIFLCAILSFMSITRSFYLLLALLIFCYNALPNKYSEDISPFIGLKQKILNFALIFLAPLCAYIYCYYLIELHLFIYDNRVNIYGGKTLDDLSVRIFFNLFLAILHFIIEYFQFVLVDNFSISSDTALFYLFSPWGMAIIGLTLFFAKEIKNIRVERKIKISKLFVINLFFAILVASVIVRFSANGYRLAMALLPIIYLFFYQQFFDRKKNFFTKVFLIIFISINILFVASFIKNSKRSSHNLHNINQNMIDLTKRFNAKKIANNINYTPSPHLMPLVHLYPKDVYIYSSLRTENLCEDLANYHEHFVDFHLIFLGYGSHNIKYVSTNNCDFILRNFTLVDINQFGLVYANKSILPKPTE